ncbi:MAG TPA: Flp family type IVb pilin [Acetobacteraceae bacterium]|nr:Flp family type IVb pilin [Acetobacteraceae bacterium]
MTYALQTALAALKDRKGVTALEYGVLAAGIIAVIAAVVFTIGSNLTTIFSDVNNKL